MKTRLLALFALALVWVVPAGAQPVVKNAAVSVYAIVADPTMIAFAPDGALYCGRDAAGSGGGNGDAVKIHRIAPGGSPVAEFGNLAISDPDALIVDVAGAVSGTPGAVLVGGVENNASLTGKIVKIAPDGTVTTLFGPNNTVYNPSGFAFDDAGRLLITEFNNGKVLVTTGGTPTVLFSLTQVSQIAVDALGRILVDSGNNTALRLYSSSGVLSNAAFATVKSSSPLARGPGGTWETDIYAVAPNGDLVRFGLDGTTNKMGSGFGTITGLAFGPDSALYACEFQADRVYRFAPPSVAAATTTVYARVTDPVRLSFASDGTLFVGRDNTGSGGRNGDAVKIHRIGPGGSPVEEYGNATISDPDGVFYDHTGQFSGTSGAVLVAGTQEASLLGKISKILPDGAITTIYGPTAFNFNPNLMVFDAPGGRLLIADDVGGKIWAMTNSIPVPLINLPLAFPLAVDALGRILTGANDTALRLYSAEGALLNAAFAQAQTNSILVRGPGGFWGQDVYFIGTNWNLMRASTSGVVSQAGTGFGGIIGFAFGPDGALYASQLNNDLIWRIAPEAPRLRIERAGATAVVSWPHPAPGWNLESTTTLVTTGTNTWTLIPPPYPTNTADYFVTESAPLGNKFYRLRKP